MNLARLVDNRSPMVVRCDVLDAPSGHEMLVTVVKLSWAVAEDGTVLLHHPQSPIRFSPPTVMGPSSSLHFPDDQVQERPGTNVVMMATAYPPPGSRATSMDVSLRVGDGKDLFVDKTVRVYGPRVWQKSLTGIAPGPPAALVPTRLTYENTYGGMDDSNEDSVPPEKRTVLIDNRNPVGKGVAKDPATLVGTDAPSVEDPNNPLSSRNPAPAGFGPIPQHWDPLLKHGGTYDAAWQRERAPIRPLDFDTRFDGCAPDDQLCATPLRGDEMYEISGVLESGKIWRFQLPLYRPTFIAKRRDLEEEIRPPTHLDTVMIDAENGVVELTWRASVRMPIVPQLMEKVTVGSLDPLPTHIEDQMMDIAREHVAQKKNEEA